LRYFDMYLASPAGGEWGNASLMHVSYEVVLRDEEWADQVVGDLLSLGSDNSTGRAEFNRLMQDSAFPVANVELLEDAHIFKERIVDRDDSEPLTDTDFLARIIAYVEEMPAPVTLVFLLCLCCSVCCLTMSLRNRKSTRERLKSSDSTQSDLAAGGMRGEEFAMSPDVHIGVSPMVDEQPHVNPPSFV